MEGPTSDGATNRSSETDEEGLLDLRDDFPLEEGALQAMEACLSRQVTGRFYRDTIPLFVETLFNAKDLSSAWVLHREILERIMDRIVEVCVSRIGEDCPVAFQVLQAVLSPSTVFHLTQGNRALRTFELEGGFEAIKERFLQLKERSMEPVMFQGYVLILKKITGYCKELGMLPIVLSALEFLSSLPLREAMDHLRSAERCIMMAPDDERIDKAYLALLLAMLKVDKLVYKERATCELNKLICSTSRLSLVVDWWRREGILKEVMLNGMYRSTMQPQVEEILHKLSKENMLFPEDLEQIWAFQFERQAAVARSVRELFSNVVYSTDPEVIAKMFSIMKSYYEEGNVQETCRLLVRMSEMDKVRDLLMFTWRLHGSDEVISAFAMMLRRAPAKSEFLMMFATTIRTCDPWSLDAVKLICVVLENDDVRYDSRAAAVRFLCGEEGLIGAICLNLVKYFDQPMTNHSEQVEQRLLLLVYLCQYGPRLEKADMERLWGAFEKRPFEDMEIFFDFVCKVVSQQQGCDSVRCMFEFLFTRMVETLDPATIGFSAVRALWVLFCIHYLGDATEEVAVNQRVRGVLLGPFKGQDFFWKVISDAPDRQSKWLRSQIMKTYSNRMLLSRPGCLLDQCLDRMDNPRVASFLMEHVLFCDRTFLEPRYIDRLVDQFVNKCVNIYLERYTKPDSDSDDETDDDRTLPDPSNRMALQFHQRNTLAQIRKAIEVHLGVGPYELVLRLAGCIAKTNIDDQMIFQLINTTDICMTFDFEREQPFLFSPSNRFEGVPSIAIAESAYARILESSGDSQVIHNLLLQCPLSTSVEDSIGAMVRQLTGRQDEDNATIHGFFIGPLAIYRAYTLYHFLNVYSESTAERIELVLRFYERGGTDFILKSLTMELGTRVHSLSVSILLIQQVVAILLKQKAVRQPIFTHPRVVENFERRSLDIDPDLVFKIAVSSARGLDINTEAQIEGEPWWDLCVNAIFLLQSGFLLGQDNFVDFWKQNIDEFVKHVLLGCPCVKVQRAAGELIFTVAVGLATASDYDSAGRVTGVLLSQLKQVGHFDGFRTACSIIQSPNFGSFRRDFTNEQVDVIMHLSKEMSQSFVAGHLDVLASLLKTESLENIDSLKSLVSFIHDYCLHTRAVWVQRRCCLCGASMGMETDHPICTETASRRSAYSVLVELAQSYDNLTLLRSIVQNRSVRQKCLSCVDTCFVDKGSPLSMFCELRSRSPDLFVGLRNAGATCYINAILQQMFMIRGLRELVLGTTFQNDSSDSTESSDGSIRLEEEDDATVMTGFTDSNHHAVDSFNSLQLTFGYLRHSIATVYNPNEFLTTFKFFGLDINPFEQHDAVEFLQMFIDTIDKAYTINRLPPVFSKTFGGEYETVTECLECGNRSVRSEEFCFVSVDVVDAHDLVESLGNYVGGERFEGLNAYECSRCKRKVEAAMRTKFRRCGPIIGFQLKRFIEGPGLDTHKYNNRFEFAETLSMKPYMSDNATSDVFDYRLRGVVIHTGGLAHGHYYSYIRNDGSILGIKDRWYKFDDNDITLVDSFEHTLEKVCFGNKGDPGSAYMIFYERDWRPLDGGNALSSSPLMDLVPQRSRLTNGIPEHVFRAVHLNNLRVLDLELNGQSEYYVFIAAMLKRYSYSGVSLETYPLESTPDKLSLDQIKYLMVSTAMDALVPLFQGMVPCVDGLRVDMDEIKSQTNIPCCIRTTCLEILEGIFSCSYQSPLGRATFLNRMGTFPVLCQFIVRTNRSFRHKFAILLEAIIVRHAATCMTDDQLIPIASIIQTLTTILGRLLEPKDNRLATGIMQVLLRLLHRGPKTFKCLVRLSFLQRLMRTVLTPNYMFTAENIGESIRHSLNTFTPAVLLILRLVRCPRSPEFNNPHAFYQTYSQLVVQDDYDTVEKTFPLGPETLIGSKYFIRLLLRPELVVHHETDAYLKYVQFQNPTITLLIASSILQSLTYELDYSKKRSIEIKTDPYEIIPCLALLPAFTQIQDNLKDRRISFYLRGDEGTRGLLSTDTFSPHKAVLVLAVAMDILDLTHQNIPRDLVNRWRNAHQRAESIERIDRFIQRSSEHLAKEE